MACVGICGSDVHYYVEGRIADFIVKSPMVIGHEASGQVVKVGKNVKHLKKGDRVAIEPGIPCRTCNFCKEGRYNLCIDVQFCATPPYDGNLCRYYTHAADFCFKLPDHVSYEEGALLEPLSVGVHSTRRGGVRVGDTVLILGSGPIGLVTTVTAKAMGARVIITDIIDHRLKLAKDLGADFVLNVQPNEDEVKLAKRIHDLVGGPVDVTIDCTGLQSTVKVGLEATKSGGTIVIVGLASQGVSIAFKDAIVREIDIRGSFRYANTYPTALSMVASGKVNVKKLITHVYKLEQTLEAFETARTGTGNPIKVMLYCNTFEQ